MVEANGWVGSVNKKKLITLVSMMMFFVGFEMGGYQLLIADISGEFGTNLTGMGLMAAAQYSSIILMPVVFGTISDRVGRKKVMLWFTAVFIVGCMAAAISGSAPVFALGVALIGAGYSVYECVSSALLSDICPEESARYINITQCSLSFGAVLAPLVIFAYERLWGPSWRAMYLICGAAFLILMLPLWRAVFPAAAAPEQSPEGKTKTPHIGSYFRSVLFTLLFAGILIYVGLENGFGYFVETLFSRRLEASSYGAYAISAYWLGMALSRMVFGMKKYAPFKALIGCFAVASVLFILLAESPWALVSLAACFCIGAAYGPIWSTLVAEAAQVYPENAAGAIGLMSSGCAIGGILFPVLMGLVADHAAIQTAFLLLAASALTGGLLSGLALLAKRNRKGK